MKVRIVFLLVLTYVRAASSSPLDKYRHEVCATSRPNAKCEISAMKSNDRRRFLDGYEIMCRAMYSESTLHRCEELKQVALKNSPEWDHAQTKLRFVSCDPTEACEYEKRRPQISAACFTGLKDSSKALLESLLATPSKVVEALSLQADRECFENKSGAKDRLFELYNLEVLDQFSTFKVPPVIQRQALKSWSCAQIRRYLQDKRRQYHQHIGPLVARGEITLEQRDAPIVELMKRIEQILGDRWHCYTPEAKAELICSVGTGFGAAAVGGLGLQSLLKKLASLGLGPDEASLLLPALQSQRLKAAEAKISTNTVIEKPSVEIKTPPSEPGFQPSARPNELSSRLQPENVSPRRTSASVARARQRVLTLFDSTKDVQFYDRLQAFRGNQDLTFDPKMHGREGQIYTSDRYPDRALKRFFRPLSGNPWDGVKTLENARERVKSNPRLDPHLEVVQIYEKGDDWIVRDFDPASKPIKHVLDNPEVKAAVEATIRELQSLPDPSLEKILHKLNRTPPSENLHWSPSRKKIFLIDFSATPALKIPPYLVTSLPQRRSNS